MKRTLMITAGMALAMMLTDAWSAGGGGGGGGGGGSGAPGIEAVAADPDFKAGMAAVKKEDWTQVITRLGAYTERNAGNADAWNELGHAYRKLGDMDNSFKNYAKALEINPRHRDAHEYLGEAYLQIGDLASAEKELRSLDSICFMPCEQFTDLKKQIRSYKAAHGQTAAR